MRFFSLLALLVALFAAAAPAEAASLFDPALRWKTIVTPHFRVNFPEGYEEVARRAAGYAEEAHQLLSPYLNEVPSQRTELNLMDNQDLANGFGFPLPNNQIFIYLTSSSEDHFSGRYDSYLRDLLIHEYTHVLHLEKTAGLPAWINGFFGRSYFPNMFQPIFLIEGLAVTTETRFSHGGRGRDSVYRAYLRVAALEDQLVGIDKASGYNTIDHPGGEIPYVYGTAFYRFLIEKYGETAPAAIAERYAHYPFFGLYGVDETLKEVTGKDAGTLWAEMQTWLTVRATVEREAILAQGPLTSLTPVTTGGMHHRRPVYRPDGTLVYAAWTGHGYSYLYGAAPGEDKAIISKGPFGRYSYSSDGRYIYHTRSWDENRFTGYDDVFRWDTKERKIERLSERERLSEPAVSPDGRWVVAVRNEKGQNNLVKMRSDGTAPRTLTTLEDHSQLGGPTWHPTRHTLALSAWQGGSRDLYFVDPETGKMRPLWRDRDVELTPVFSPDGRYLVYSSDATGVFNLYAYALESGELFRMTNVLGGLFEPAVSPDMKTVAATSYGLGGFDVVTLPWDPASWTPVAPPESDAAIVQPPPAVDAGAFPVVDYDPWPSVRPKFWAPFGYMDPSGPILGFTTLGQDSLFQHFLYGAFGYATGANRPYYQLGYSNDVLYPSLYAYALDSPLTSFPRHAGVTFQVPQRGLYQGLSVTFPGLPSAFLQNNWVTGDTIALGLSLRNISDTQARDPLLPAEEAPPTGQTNALSVTYKFGDNYKFARSISPEGGNLVTLGYEKALGVLGSEHLYDRVWADWRRYIALPWQHHVLAVRGSGGVSLGERGGDFYLGGFDSSTILSNVDLRTASSVGTRQLPLRGYFFGADMGPKGAALSAEYRFPLMSVQRGWGIYPVFIRNLHGAVFVDAGQTWKDQFRWQETLVGAGAELRAQTYFIQAPTEIRFGLGQGLVAEAGSVQWPAVFIDVGSYF